MDIPLIENTLRLLSAVVMTVSTAYIARNLFFTRTLRPRAVWAYVGAVATAVMVWRWTVLFAGGDPVGVWTTPVSASMYFLLSVSIGVLAVVSTQKRRNDGQ